MDQSRFFMQSLMFLINVKKCQKILETTFIKNFDPNQSNYPIDPNPMGPILGLEHGHAFAANLYWFKTQVADSFYQCPLYFQYSSVALTEY